MKLSSSHSELYVWHIYIFLWYITIWQCERHDETRIEKTWNIKMRGIKDGWRRTHVSIWKFFIYFNCLFCLPFLLWIQYPMNSPLTACLAWWMLNYDRDVVNLNANLLISFKSRLNERTKTRNEDFLAKTEICR